MLDEYATKKNLHKIFFLMFDFTDLIFKSLILAGRNILYNKNFDIIIYQIN